MTIRAAADNGLARVPISGTHPTPDARVVMAQALLRILIVDDLQPMRAMIKDVIGDMAGEMFEASNAEEGLRQFRMNQPDLVLMDLSMPGINGIEATRRLTAEFPNSRVIIVTQNDSGRLREAARSAGACGYFLKENLLSLRECIGTNPF
jgi:DNA-binding NarL/FixJ family response regulator